jgi:K+-sensing histidine kinase KdpD
MEFVSVVSHQIRAPLTNIRGAVEKLQIDGHSDEDMLVIVEEQAERLDRLVRGVLSADKIEAGNLVLQTEPTSLYPLLHGAVAQFRSRDQSHLVEIPTQSLPLVEADADRVLEILTNLLDNASKYSPEKSEITFSAQRRDKEVVLSIMDKGKGVSKNDLEHVFEKFYRSDSSDSQVAYGYGLGLYICRQLVEAMQGRIWVENHPKAGAVFSFSLPIWQETHG